MSDPTLRRLESTDAFVVIDYPDAPSADGVVRCAKKVLVDSTRSLARSRTYAWAVLEQRISGASAAINAVGEARGPAFAAFCDELADRVASESLMLAPGKGVEPEDLSALGTLGGPDPTAFAAGVLACISAAGDPTSKRVAVEYDGAQGEGLLEAALIDAGAEVVATGGEALGADADILLFGSKPALIDHEVVPEMSATLLVPTGILALTPRALAVASRRGITVLPDFLTTAGPLAARVGLDPTTVLTRRCSEVLEHDEGPVMGACVAAEEFLSSWVDELPFGRPIG